MPKHNLKKLVVDLKAQQEAFDRELAKDLSETFGIPVSGVEGYTADQDTMTETGVLVSGGTRFRFRIDGAAGVKELLPEKS